MNMKTLRPIGMAVVFLLLPVFCYGQVSVASKYQERYSEDMERYCTVVIKNTGNTTATTFEFHIYGAPRTGDAFYVKSWKTTVKENISPGTSKTVALPLPSDEYEVVKIKLAVARYSDGRVSYPEPD